MITINDLHKIDIRLGKIIKVELLKNAKYTTHKLTIDFGKDIGIKTSGARVVNYSFDQLIGKNVIGVVNLQPRQIGKIISEVLVLGIPDEKNECILLTPDKINGILGAKVY